MIIDASFEPSSFQVDLPEVSVKETGKQNRSPSSKYKRMKSTSSGKCCPMVKTLVEIPILA